MPRGCSSRDSIGAGKQRRSHPPPYPRRRAKAESTRAPSSRCAADSSSNASRSHAGAAPPAIGLPIARSAPCVYGARAVFWMVCTSRNTRALNRAHDCARAQGPDAGVALQETAGAATSLAVARRRLLLPYLKHRRRAKQRIVEMVDDPHAAERDDPGQQDARQRMHERDEQGRKRRQDPLGGQPQLPGGTVERPDHGDRNDDQQDDLQQRPILPWRRRELGDLVDGPIPDEPDEAEDRSDPLLQEVQDLIENLMHGDAPRRLASAYAARREFFPQGRLAEHALAEAQPCDPGRRSAANAGSVAKVPPPRTNRAIIVRPAGRAARSIDPRGRPRRASDRSGGHPGSAREFRSPRA